VPQPKPQKAILYRRISDARNGDDAGVRDQESDLRNRAAELGWGIGRVIVENDTSAFKRRKITLPDGSRAMRVVRPGWREMLADLASGRADGLLALDLDRVARDPRDLEDLVDVIETKHPRIPVESVTGSLRLANDADVTMARVQVAIANKASRDTQRRVARARLRQASEGRYGGGRRPFGFESDGVTVRATEAAELVKAAEAILAGASMRSLVADLRARNVPTVTGAPWTSQSLREALLRPRTAGLMVYQDEIVEGVAAPWPAILPRETWEAVRKTLLDDIRRTTPGSTPRWLGSGLYVCGHPAHIDADAPMTLRAGTAGVGVHRVRAYKCQVAHLARAAAPLDALIGGGVVNGEDVTGVIPARLARPDAAQLLVPRVDADVPALSAEANGLRARITEARLMWESGDLTAAEFRSSASRMREKLATIEAKLTAAAGSDPLADLAGRPDAIERWKRLDLGRKRAILDRLATVTVLPSRRGRRFDVTSIRVQWKTT
jgi:site-specific DNA recombinase